MVLTLRPRYGMLNNFGNLFYTAIKDRNSINGKGAVVPILSYFIFIFRQSMQKAMEFRKSPKCNDPGARPSTDLYIDKRSMSSCVPK